MIKVKIYNNNTDTSFISEMPYIPKKGDNIGCWHNNLWLIGDVDCIVYEFNKNNDFLLVEISANLK